MKTKQFYLTLLASSMLVVASGLMLSCTDNVDNTGVIVDDEVSPYVPPTEDCITTRLDLQVANISSDKTDVIEKLLNRCDNLQTSIDENTQVILLNSVGIGSLSQEMKQTLKDAYERNVFFVVHKPLKEIINNFRQDLAQDDEPSDIMGIDDYDIVGFNKHGDRFYLEKLLKPDIRTTMPSDYALGQCAEAFVNMMKEVYKGTAKTRAGETANDGQIVTFGYIWTLEAEEWHGMEYPKVDNTLTTTLYIESAYQFSTNDTEKGDDYYCIKVDNTFPANNFYVKKENNGKYEHASDGLSYAHWGYTAIEHISKYTWAANQGDMKMLQCSPETTNEQGEVSTSSGYDIGLGVDAGWASHEGANVGGSFSFGYNYSTTESWSISDVTVKQEFDYSSGVYPWHYNLTVPEFENNAARGKLKHVPPVGQSTIHYTQSMLICVKDSRNNTSDMKFSGEIYNVIEAVAHQYATWVDRTHVRRYTYTYDINLKDYAPNRYIGHYRAKCKDIADYDEFNNVADALSRNSSEFTKMLGEDYYLSGKTNDALKDNTNAKWDKVCKTLVGVKLSFVKNKYEFKLYDEDENVVSSKILTVNNDGTVTAE